MSAGTGRVLGPAVAGTWYPAAASALEREVERLLAHAPASAGAPPTALIAPHAGFAYSGEVAAAGFRRLRGCSFERVVLVGPSHHAGFRGAIVPEADACRTPLGDVLLDRDAVDALGQTPGFDVSSRPFLPEHCLEAELPFLQCALAPGFRIVPVLVGGRSSSADLARAAQALAPWVDARTLVVVSSDFTHYGSAFGYVPFRDDVPDRLRRLDLGAVERIVALDPEGFERYADDTGATICGRHAISIVLRLLRPGASAELLAYDTSGRMTGDFAHSVSYASIGFREPVARS